MADPNPLDSFLHSETDESVVNALVASLESRLASPTHKEQSPTIPNPSVNSNHVSNVSSISACTSAQNNSVHLSNDTGNTINSNAKSVIKNENQILGINSIHTNSPVAHVNSPVNSHRTASPKPLNSVNKSSPAIQVITQPQNHGNHSVVANPHMNRATPSPSNVISVNNINVAQSNSNIIITNPGVVQNNSALKHVNRTSLSPAPQQNSTGQIGGVQQSQPIVRNSQGVVINSNSQQLTQKTNVHIVHSANVTSVITQPGSNPSVITVRGQVPSSHITTVRPQVVTTHVSNSPSPRLQGSVRIQNRMPNAPIRIASSQPNQQINIAPRPGSHPGTITLPPGIVPGQGAVLMKNEQGQIVIVQPGSLPGQHPASSVTISSSSTPQKVQYVRHPNTGATQRLPNSQILTIQPGAQSQPQTVVRQAVPAPVNASRIQPGIRVTMPGSMQTVVRTTAPGGTSTVGHSHGVSSGQQSAAAQAAQQQQMVENVKKCKNFLSTLIKLAASQPEATVSSVRDLIQGLIDGKLEPEVFTEKLQKELKSSPQPYLVPFLKKSLPLLRQSLLNNKMTIDGVKPPPIEIVQQHQSASQVGHSSTHNQVIPKVGGQFHPKPSVAQVTMVTGKPSMTKQMNMMQSNIPSTVKAFHSRVAGLTPSSSPGPSHSHKDTKRVKESFKDDDDINDVATMGGVNLTEESRNILATNAEFIGTQIRSCKDEAFLAQGPLTSRIHAIARRHGITEVPTEVANLVSHATQERLRHIVEKLSTIAEQRTEIYKMNEKFDSSLDVRAQLKFLEELDVLERKRHDEQEKEMLRRAAKSRSKFEDPEHLKLKQRAKDLQAAEMEEVRQREANLTALAAIGPRKKRKLDETSSGSSNIPNGSSSSNPRTALRPRIKRVNLRDLMFLMEQDKTLNKSNTLYRTFLK
ncbi:transcription initiation factor TFIID subunit 4-like [Mercenaria mercenaria]|uniref:transcription initiation factor TFIID subunit 4-like n=1 Tax=Mercenaria mercenaria TaxID=6596 RepID=UPI00234F4FA0|nr:transcription initiation factor TFIID subunit 4-like [Mercenaria mercenaria]